MGKRVLRNGWRLKQLPVSDVLEDSVIAQASASAWDEGWLEIDAMPAMVHDVLQAHDVIEPPWLPGRAEACRWVSERDWVYAVNFTVDDPAGTQTLHLRGLDTIVDVYLNDEKVGEHSNMVMPLRLDVTEAIRRENTLLLHFHTVFDLSGDEPEPLDIVGGDPPRPVRRPRQNYNTYLGPHPYFSRMGVFKDVILETVTRAEIAQLRIDAAVDETLSEGSVYVDVTGLTHSADLSLRLQILAPDGSTAAEVAARPEVTCDAYLSRLTLEVEDPELWWPRGYGAQSLYQVVATLTADGVEVQQERRAIGFRRVTMPEPLHFEVNGVPVKLWGGNWVSPDWVTAVWDRERAERLFDIAENANFNALRVWGVVEPPDDHFYELADRRGFMIWQDFHILPLMPDPVSRAICREEVAHTITRLQHHPSIMMWCGGNEATMWHEREFGGPGGEWPGREVAEGDVQEVCAAIDPARFYLPNSPYGGIDANDPQVLDTHGYTNMWYVPGYDTLNFVSEDTRIAAPPLHSLKRFFAPEDLWPESYTPVYTHGHRYPWPESWMGYTTSESWRKTGPVEQFYDATGPGELVYRLGMAAGQYYRETIERQRRGRPAEAASDRRRCGGYLVWKYNDSWPEIYSGKVDYFLEPIIPYYAIKRAYAPVLLSFDVGTYIWLWLVNDTTVPVAGDVTVQLFHLDENAVKQTITRSVRADPGQSVEIVRLDRAGIGTFHLDHILYARLDDANGSVVARTQAFADVERQIVFPEAKLDVHIEDGALVITTDRFARSVVLEGDADGDPFGWLFEDNYFDLMPGERKVVRVLGRHDRGRITARPWYSPHETTVDW
jgi:hypothetical protein